MEVENLVCKKCLDANNSKSQRSDLYLQCFHGQCKVCEQENMLVECNFFSVPRNKLIPHFIAKPHIEAKGQYDDEIDDLKSKIILIEKQLVKIDDKQKVK